MAKVRLIQETLEHLYPHAECELIHHSALELLVAVMLSAQTTDAMVNRVTPALFLKYRSPEDYVKAPLEDLEDDLKRIGLYKNKAKNLQSMMRQLLAHHNGQVPADQAALEALAGVGRKTANVVLSVWFHEPRFAVDTHVIRVSKRLRLAYLKDDPLTIEKKLMKKFPRSSWSKLHHQFIFFGRYHCKAKSPLCDQCPLQPECRYPHIHV
jgi:endonuclease-3